jgi:hypothetical protein
VQERVPLMIGGSGRRVLRCAAERADVVGLTGLGATLADGHSHSVDWAPDAVAAGVEDVVRTAGAAGRQPELEALVQHVEVTDDAEAAAQRLAATVEGTTAADLLAAPYVWIGTVEEIRERLVHHREALGIERYVARAPALADVRRVLAVLPAD